MINKKIKEDSKKLLESFLNDTISGKRSYKTYDNGFMAAGVLKKSRDHIIDEINTITIRLTTEIKNKGLKVTTYDCTRDELKQLIAILDNLDKQL
jgi:hypothetical protein